MNAAPLSYQDALDEIYHWFMAKKPVVKGRFDRDVRDPTIIVDIARDLDLVPPPGRTLRVTGSKGKGTVSRTIANALRRLTAQTVGLVVSPEEFEHTDRMQIDGMPITQTDFLRHYGVLRPRIFKAAQSLIEDRYLSPSGIFLLTALSWFRERGVQLFVLESGRGARFDETGQIPSGLAVVTSVFMEHAGYLGPGIADIAAEKLHIGTTSETLILGESAAEWRHLVPSGADVIVPSRGDAGEVRELPAWMLEDKRLAEETVSKFLGRDVELAEGDMSSAAFEVRDVGATRFYVEPLVSEASIDDRFVDALAERFGARLAVIVSLPDDKDIGGVVDAFAARDIAPLHIVLHGTRGYLSYEAVRSRYPDQILEDLKFDNITGLSSLFRSLVDAGDHDALYVIGTHTFIRTVKLAVWSLEAG